jgi:hypothetical protein
VSKRGGCVVAATTLFVQDKDLLGEEDNIPETVE